MLAARGVTKAFGSLTAVDDVDLDIRPGVITGVIGENGAGKTTLMRVLTGEEPPDAGRILIDGHETGISSTADALAHGITMVHQHFALSPGALVSENVVLGREPGSRWLTTPKTFAAEVEQLSGQAGLSVDASAVTGGLSVGLRQRVEILKSLYRDARYLILDEPTSVLTPQETETLFEQLRRLAAEGVAVVFISHKLPEVLEIAQRVAVMRRGSLVCEIDRSEATSTSLATLMIGREPAKPHQPAPLPADAPVSVEVERLTAPGLHDVSFDIRSGEIVGVAAVEGNGQSELLGALAGTVAVSGGAVRVGGDDITRWSPRRRRDAGIGYVPEDRHSQAMPQEATLFEALAEVTLHRPGEPGRKRRSRWLARMRTPAAVERARSVVDRFGVIYESIDSPCGSISGGNQQKAVFAREVAREPALLLLGQPTRGVDVGAVHELHGQILRSRSNGAAILLVSADLDEILELSDRVIVMYEGRIVADTAIADTSRLQIGARMAGASA